MNRRIFSLLFATMCLSLGGVNSTIAQQEVARPITGKVVEKFAAFDPVIEKHMDHIGATAASFAIQLNGRIVYSRAFGWADKEMKVPVTTDSMFRIASNTKPITKAIVRQLVKKKKDLKLSTKVFPFLGIEPVGDLGDERLNDISIEHLLKHTGGWDKTKTFDPIYKPKTISKFHNIKVADLTKEHIVSYMLGQPLQYEPGSKKAYSNFGFVLLGMVIEKVSKKSYAEVVVEFAQKLKLEIEVSSPGLEGRNEAEVSYPREYRLVGYFDAAGGLACSAESLCKFMKKYWTNGERRSKKKNYSLVHLGRHVKCTNALMEHRKDGIDYVLLFNSTRDKGYLDDLKSIRKSVNDTIEQIKKSN